MDLKAKLSRLGTAPPLTRGERGTSPDTGERRADPATLDELRTRMAAILGREAPAPRPPARASDTTLPFADHHTPSGIVYRRLERLAPSHHVGRMPVDAAADAEARMLALLALGPELADCDPSRALFLDTETTGLHGAGTVAFLVGLAWFDDERRLHAEQLLLRSRAEEPALLELLRERMRAASLLVTYNGKSFDLPMLRSRTVMARVEPLPELPHLDLLHVGRRLHKARLGACRLKTLESEVLGFDRGDGDIEGAEIGACYNHFLRSGDEGALLAVVEHNLWDVLSMAALVALYGEPLEGLHRDDLPSLASTLQRAKDNDAALLAADVAVQRGGAGALAIRARINKARGDRARALADFEQLADEVDDAAVRLELAKLYEHFVKQPERALQVLGAGTGECNDAVEKRRARLERKLARAAEKRGGR